MARGSKPHRLKVINGPQSVTAAPTWLTEDAKAEWRVAAADLAARGLLFRGSLGLLATYCITVAAVRQRQAILDADPVNRQAFAEQMKAAQHARALAVELGLSVTSRARSFTAQPAKGDDWGDVVNG